MPPAPADQKVGGYVSRVARIGRAGSPSRPSSTVYAVFRSLLWR